MKYASLFSGVECASVAWKPLGWEPVIFAEIDPFASAVLAHRFPNVPNVGDVTDHDWTQYRGKVDLVIGGSPCVAFSVAGRRKSLEDSRGRLTLAFVEAVNDIDPPWTCWENVPGVLSCAKDNAFGCFLGGMVGADEALVSGYRNGRWPDAGLVVGPRRAAAWTVADAQFFGVPQRRRRVFLVAVALSHPAFTPGKTPNPASIFSFRHRRVGNPAAGGKAWKEAIGDLGGGPPRGSGNAAFIPIAGAGIDNGSAPASAVTAKWAKGCGGPAGDECQNLVAIAFNAKDGGDQEGEVVPTLRAMGHDASHANGGGQVAVAIRTAQSSANGCGIAENLAHTLDASGPEAVAYRDEDIAVGGAVAHTLRAEGADASEDGTGRGTPVVALALRGRDGGASMEEGGGTAFALRASQGGGDKAMIAADLAVRRLTPRCCERLMGLPDDWTLIPYGRPRQVKDLSEMAAYWGVTEDVARTLAADSLRYKACGNGMAVPCVWWLGKRIEWVLAQLAEADE